MSSYEADYNEMKVNFIYGQALEFNELTKKLNEIQTRFHAIE
jgi:hypothetical protein